MSEPFLQITIFPAPRHTSEHSHAVHPAATSTSSPPLSAPVSNASTASTPPSTSAARSTASDLSASSSLATLLSTPESQTQTSPTPSEASSLSRWGTALIQDVGARFAALRSGLTWPGAGRSDATNSDRHSLQQACLRDSHGASPNQIARGWASPLSPCYCDLCVKLAREREREREIAELPGGTPTNIDEAEESVTATFISLYESEVEGGDTTTHQHEAGGQRTDQQAYSSVASEDSTHCGATASPLHDRSLLEDINNEVSATKDHLISQLYDDIAHKDRLIELYARQLDHHEAYAHGRHRHFERSETSAPPQRPDTRSSTSKSPSAPSSPSTTPSNHIQLTPGESSNANATQADQHSGPFTPSTRQLGSDRLAAHRGSVMEAGVELDRTVVGGVEILQSGRGVRVWRRG